MKSNLFHKTLWICCVLKYAREIECESDAAKFNNNKPMIYLLPLPLETQTA